MTLAQATISNGEIRDDLNRIQTSIEGVREPQSLTVMYQLQEYSRVMDSMMETVVRITERVFTLVDKTMEHKDKQLYEQRAASRRWLWISMSLAGTLFYVLFRYWLKNYLGIEIPFI